MTKGHNKDDKNQSQRNEEQGKHQNRHLSDQQKKKGPQGRHADKDQSGGTKGQNAI